jgi:hypothetical protein
VKPETGIGVCYNLLMSTNPTYTIQINPVGDHLEVHIPEIGVTVSTEPGEVKREDAEKVAGAAISAYQRQQYEAAQVKAS